MGALCIANFVELDAREVGGWVAADAALGMRVAVPEHPRRKWQVQRRPVVVQHDSARPSTKVFTQARGPPDSETRGASAPKLKRQVECFSSQATEQIARHGRCHCGPSHA
jgi:hypothetical protein